MKSLPIIVRGNLVLPDRVLAGGAIRLEGGRIREVGPAAETAADRDVGAAQVIDAGDGYIAPGFVDLHVHGGAGADFMDGTDEAFQTALAAHARHGTTSMAVTTTVARHDRIMTVLETTHRFRERPAETGSRVLGAHFYGPYFRYEARGAHPGGPIRPPVAEEYEQYLAYADS
ncbi:MAG: amidohydrolase family protein, partial [Planctomycetaceae bacterium]|nr:amidohydrolase family protein [Planctomycetaceae bacterium]